MPQTVTKERFDVPLNMLQGGSETLLKNLQSRRRAHGRVLRRAAQLAGFDSDKELAAALGTDENPVSPSQLSAWFAGTENPQTWRFEQHPVLGEAYLLAQAEAREIPVNHTLSLSIPFLRPRTSR